MRCGPGVFVLAVLLASACRDRQPAPTSTLPSPSSSSYARSSSDASLGPASPRVVCAPVQGPTKVADAGAGNAPADAVIASSDGKVALYLRWHGEADATGHDVELRAPNEPTRTARLRHDVNPMSRVFRGPNVIGFSADKHPSFGAEGFIVWATLTPLAVFTRPLLSTVHDVGSRIYFDDPSCKIHLLDLRTGEEHPGPVKSCSAYRVWGDAIAIGEPRHVGIGNASELSGFDFGGRVVDPDTGKPRPKPHCPRPIEASCVTFDSDLHTTFNDDPAGPSSASSTSEKFEVRGPHGELVRGEVRAPHHALSPNHATLWRETTGRALAFVANNVEGHVGAQLIVVDATRVSVTPLTPEEEIDQRRISALRSFVPEGTPPTQIDALVRERETALAASTNDRVRFMEYSAAASAHIPCTAPPP